MLTSNGGKPRQNAKDDLKSRGLFITFEGIDGSGKTAQCKRLVQYLRRLGYKVRATREPGGTAVGEKVRAILLASQDHLSPLTELVLFYAARAQHIEDVIRPALDRGEIVVTDRFNDCSFVYQGYARGLGNRVVRLLDRAICGPVQPDLTLVLDLDARVALDRALRRESRRGSMQSRFEAEGLKFQERVRRGYRARARRDPERVRLIPADRPPKEVEAEIQRVVGEGLGVRSQKSGAGSKKSEV
ncbi:MAG TPA: dTMP kinase [Terriglobia bacterium]|nr:dTMP kinase [Terriglobia bacterium]